MNPFAQNGGMPLSRITAASLADMGYTVNLAACDPYSLSAAALSINPFERPAIVSLENDIATDVVIKEILPNGTLRPIRRP
jgi:hypothetical protein